MNRFLSKTRWLTHYVLPTIILAGSAVAFYAMGSTPELPRKPRAAATGVFFLWPERSVLTTGDADRIAVVTHSVGAYREPRPEGDERPGFDSVTLAADQRTLILDLKVAPHKLDQLRVLFEAE